MLIYGWNTTKYSADRPKDITSIQLPEKYGKDTMEFERSLLYEWLEKDKLIDIYWGSYRDMKKAGK